MFLLNKEKDAFSFALRQLWSALIPDADAIEALMGAMEASESALEVFTGMKCEIELARGSGYEIRKEDNEAGEAMYAAYDVEKGDKLTDDFDNVESVKAAAKDAGWYPSYTRIKDARATNVEENVEALRTAIAEGFGSKGGKTDSSEAESSGTKRRAPSV